jgi:phage tail sheath protein FI
MCDLGRVDKPIGPLNSINDFIAKCGNRVSYSILYDAVDTFFREGGFQCYVGRVVGPAATKGNGNLLDNASAVSLAVTALGPGAQSSSISVQVIAGSQAGSYQLVVTYAGVVVEQSADLFTQTDGVTWANTYSNYISIAVGASALPPVTGGAAVPLSAGTDDRSNATDTQWANALAVFTKDYGPGQVSHPGRTTDTAHLQLLSHAQANMRTALLDAPDTPTSATVKTSATNATAGGNGQYGAMFAPWLIVPGVIAGTTRTVPPSALVAGAIAESDPSKGPGAPVAGANGLANYAMNIDQPAWDDTTRDTLNTAGVCVIRFLQQQVTIFGYRSLANPNTQPGWIGFGTSRYLQNLAFRCWNTGQQFLFMLLDGQGQAISKYQAALTALLQADYTLGEIFGATPDQAFSVDTGPAVNTPSTLAQNQMIANVSVRPSPMAELVTIQIINIPITQSVP